jgi:GAF domain-containing protein
MQVNQNRKRRLVEGCLPGVVPDARGDGRVMNLDITREAGIGAYVGAPLWFSDGRLYGTLCALSHSPIPRSGSATCAS